MYMQRDRVFLEFIENFYLFDQYLYNRKKQQKKAYFPIFQSNFFQSNFFHPIQEYTQMKHGVHKYIAKHFLPSDALSIKAMNKHLRTYNRSCIGHTLYSQIIREVYNK